MKKLALTLIFFSATLLPGIAQVNETDEVPIGSLTYTKGNFPPAIIQTVKEIFTEARQVQLSMAPKLFVDKGQVTSKEDFNSSVDQYEVMIKTNNGINVDAIFAPSGQLISSREVIKNASLPLVIAREIGKTPYKGWKVSGDTEVIKDRQNTIVEHYMVRLEKGGQKKTLHFTRQGDMVSRSI